jgi:hypothetical protein
MFRRLVRLPFVPRKPKSLATSRMLRAERLEPRNLPSGGSLIAVAGGAVPTGRSTDLDIAPPAKAAIVGAGWDYVPARSIEASNPFDLEGPVWATAVDDFFRAGIPLMDQDPAG